MSPELEVIRGVSNFKTSNVDDSLPILSLCPMHIENGEMAELLKRKKDLKKRLKKIDENFYRKYNRNPSKADKEPIRYLYNEYNALKYQIRSMSGIESCGTVDSFDISKTSHQISDRCHRSKSSSMSGITLTAVHYRLSAKQRNIIAADHNTLWTKIFSFENEFTASNGRPPKGETERAPLSSTYIEYRECKRSLRADAACRIQALWRGVILRMQASKFIRQFPKKNELEFLWLARYSDDKLLVELKKLEDEKNVLHQKLQLHETKILGGHEKNLDPLNLTTFTDLRMIAKQYVRYKEIKKRLSYLQEYNFGAEQ